MVAAGGFMVGVRVRVNVPLRPSQDVRGPGGGSSASDFQNPSHSRTCQHCDVPQLLNCPQKAACVVSAAWGSKVTGLCGLAVPFTCS